jgi:hypothetical protein
MEDSMRSIPEPRRGSELFAPGPRLATALALAILGTACPKNIHTFTPAPSTFTTFKLQAGTIDTSGASCTPATPPALADPATPGTTEVLVGYQDWRNTVTDSNGQQCGTSNAKRWQGAVSFDMSAVIADLSSAGAFSTAGATLVYRIKESFENPAPANATPMCAARVEVASATPVAGGLVVINGATGANFPASSTPSLGALALPDTAPLSGSATQGPATVVAQGFGQFPSVTVDVSLALNDWLATKPPMMTLVLPPIGPTIAQLGITSNPPTPIPVSRSTAECHTFIDTVTLTVNIGR